MFFTELEQKKKSIICMEEPKQTWDRMALEGPPSLTSDDATMYSHPGSVVLAQRQKYKPTV